MKLRFLWLCLILLPILACGNPLADRAKVDVKITRVRLARFNTVTPSPSPAPTLSPSPTSTPTATLTPVPTVSPPPPTATPWPTTTSTPTKVLAPAPKPTATPGPAAVRSEVAVLPAPAVEPAILAADAYHLGYGVQLAEAKNMALAAKNGFTWAKHDLNLRKDTNFLTNADNLLSDLRKSGTEHVLLKLIVWTAAGLPDAPRTADEVNTFAKNAGEAAKFVRNRHGDLFTTIAYEIWNEPNLNYEWEGNPNPAEYVALLRATSAAIRQADPQAFIVSGAPSPGGDYDDLKFLEGMYAGGVKGLMDAVGSHPYGGPWAPNHPTGVDASGNGYPYFRKPEAQRAIMEKYGDIETQIWATEFSWLAGLPGCNFGEHTPWQVTVQQQADYLVTAYQYAHQNWPWMGPMFVVYDFGLTGRYDRCHPAGGYSILRPEPNSDNIVSPAAAALFAMPKYPGR